MNIVKRSNTPVSAFRPGLLEDQFGQLIETMFQDMFAPLGVSRQAGAAAQACMNVTENDQAFEVEVEMPGVKKEDVKVTLDQQRVTIEGEAKRESEQRDGDNVVYSERSIGKYMRSFTLPTNVDDSSAEARMENGVLKLTLPKKPDSASKRLTIQ